MVYHVGIGKRGRTMIIEARRCIDSLSCNIYDYLGERITTKAQLHRIRYTLLQEMKRRNPDVYGNLRFAIVD